MVVAPEHIRTLHKYEKAILAALERLMKRYEWVPLDTLQQSTGLSESEVMYRISRLMEWGMVRFNAVPYDGYALVFGGIRHARPFDTRPKRSHLRTRLQDRGRKGIRRL